MDTLWISEFSFLCLQCFYISMTNTAEFDTTIRYLDANTVNISCLDTSQIQIENIDVDEEKTPCRDKPCILNSQDTQTIKDNCNGNSSCLFDYNFTSTCLREFRYLNLSYTCKYENRTSNFEEDFGDWSNVSSSNFQWKRNKFVFDHTRINPEGSKGYSIDAQSSRGKPGKARIDTDNEFMESICLSLWYQFFDHSFDCSFHIYRIYDDNSILLFTAEGNSTLFGQWKNISLDVYDQVPFKIALEADFKHRNTASARAILVDDTSISYRPCTGQQIDTNCQDINTPITIECETQFLAGNITLTFQQGQFAIYQTNCQDHSTESELNTLCATLNNSDRCKFRVFDFMNNYDDCIVFSKNISVTYQCIDTRRGSLELSVRYTIIGIAAGVSGGVLLTIIALIVICRIKRYKPGNQEATSRNDNKAFDELQYDNENQQKTTLSQSCSQNKITPTNSNLNIPELLDKDGAESADLYNMSNEDGTYDVSSNNRQRETPNDNNIYNHMADNIYDSGSHQKLSDRNKETYDHFFGQQTEDEYDTTART